MTALTVVSSIKKLNRYKAILPPLLILMTALLTRTITLDRTFIVNDETLYWRWTNEFTAALLNFDWRGTLVGKGYPSVTVFWVHNLGFLVHYLADFGRGYPAAEFWSRSVLDQPFVFEMLGQRRLAMGVINALLIGLIFFQAKKLLGETIAFLGTVLMIFAPFLLADARTMRGDALMSSLMLLSTLALLNFLRFGRWSQLIFSGVTLGLAVLTKITAIPVAGFGGLAVAAYLLSRSDWTWSARLRWGGLILVGWGAIALLTLFIFWPALWVAPLDVLYFMSSYAEGSIDGRLNYFWGRLTHDEPLHLFYPNAFLFRATPLVVLGVGVMVGLMFVSGWRLAQNRVAGQRIGQRWGRILHDLWELPQATCWALLALGSYALIYWLVLNVGALKRDRYLMPVFPAVMFLAAAGLLWLIKWLMRRWPGNNLPYLLANGGWVWATFLFLATLQVGHILSTHPFYYTYWSPLMGGGRVAAQAMMAESGVESSALVELSQTGAADETTAVLYTRDFAPAYAGEVVRLANHTPWITADHILLRQYHYQTEKLDPHLVEYLARQAPEKVVEFQGYPWGWVYAGPSAQFFSGALLDGKARLLGYNLSDTLASPAAPLRVKLFWRQRGLQPAEKLFVRLVDPTGFRWVEGVARPLPDFSEAAHTLEAIVESEAVLDISPGTPPGLYHLKIGVAGDDGPPDVGEFDLPSQGSAIVLEKTTLPGPALVLNRESNQKMGSNLTLLGFNLESDLVLTPPTPGRLTLYWQVDDQAVEAYQIRLALIDSNGQQAMQWIGPPARGIYPIPDWRPGDLIRDPWLLDPATRDRPPKTGRYALNVALLNGKTGQIIEEVELTEVEVVDRRRMFTRPPLENVVEARLGPAITLLGYNLSQAPLTGGARFEVELFWQASQPVSTNYTVFVQMLGPDGAVVGQHDGLPGEGAIPTTIWAVDEIIPDRHVLEFPTTQPGEYRLIVGLYDPTSGDRLPIIETNSAPNNDFILLHAFTISEEG